VNFNRLAERWAARRGKPMIGNGDIHRLRQLDTTYSLVDAPRDADAICAAIAAGKVVVEHCPLGWAEVASIMTDISGWRTHAGSSTQPTSDSGSTSISLARSV
jgi:hypothetical protein